MKAARTTLLSVLLWGGAGAALASACGGSNALLSQGDAGSDASSGSSSGSSGSGGSSGSSGSGGGSSGGGSGSSSGTASSSGGSSGSSSGGGQCGQCENDLDCQACVTPPEGSSNCCQPGQGTCWVVPSPTCPGSSSSSGGSGGGSSGGGSGSSSGGGMCGSCSTDVQCQLTCPPVQGGGTNCCESSTGVCYAVLTTTCPVPQDASTE